MMRSKIENVLNIKLLENVTFGIHIYYRCTNIAVVDFIINLVIFIINFWNDFNITEIFCKTYLPSNSENSKII